MIYVVESEKNVRIIEADDIGGAESFARVIFQNSPFKVREATEEEKKLMQESKERILAGMQK